MRAFGAVILRDGVDPVALLEVLLGHPPHVVLHDLRRVLHALALDGRRLYGKREPDGGRQRRCGEKTRTHPWTPCPCAPRIEGGKSKVGRVRRNVSGGPK